MRNSRLVSYATAMATVLVLVMSLTATADSVPRMSTDELKSRLGEDGLVVLDVRTSGDWANSKSKIAGAERVDLSAVNQWANNYPKAETIVLYCA
jgi:rhodanese-related sulfurtransferase